MCVCVRRGVSERVKRRREVGAEGGRFDSHGLS